MSMTQRARIAALLSNVPIPEPVIAAIGVGLGLQKLVPVRVLRKAHTARRWGGATIGAGIALIAWSTFEARGQRIDEPDRLLTEGSYALSRNPMYVGWLGIAAGLGLVLNSAWLLISACAALLYLDAVEIPREEAVLMRAFGARYARYRDHVPRYGLRAATGSVPRF
jgi:protein-S-isoprenylcysteine O-methyltransferase Ste14